MALRDWQSALGQLVEARASGRELQPVLDTLGKLELDEAERAWLRKVVDSRGFALTGYVPSWWRDLRVRRCAKLTMGALRETRDAVLRAYLRATPCTTLFFVSEGLTFLEYVMATTAQPHVRAVAEFERALWVLQRDASGPLPPVREPAPGELLARSPGASLVTFEAAPETILGALVSGAPLPEGASEPHAVLIAPGVPRRWRPATAEEARVFAACATPAEPEAVAALPDVTPEAIRSLLSAGAVVPQARGG